MIVCCTHGTLGSALKLTPVIQLSFALTFAFTCLAIHILGKLFADTNSKLLATLSAKISIHPIVIRLSSLILDHQLSGQLRWNLWRKQTT